MELVLTVSEALDIAKRGVLVLPSVPLSRFAGFLLPRLIEIRLPNGSTKSVAAHFSIPRVSPPPKEISFLCMLPSQQAASVPIGTEIWAALEVEAQ